MSTIFDRKQPLILVVSLDELGKRLSIPVEIISAEYKQASRSLELLIYSKQGKYAEPLSRFVAMDYWKYIEGWEE